MQLEKLEKLGSELTVFKEPNELMVSNFFIKGDYVNDLVAEIKADAEKHKPDVSTLKGRNAIKANITKIVNKKTTIEKFGKDLSSEYKNKPKLIDATRSKLNEEITKLQVYFRKELTYWEEQEKIRIENDRIKAEKEKVQAQVDQDHELAIEQYKTHLREVSDKKIADELADKLLAEKQEEDRIKREAEIVRQAAEDARIKAELEAEKVREKIEREKQRAINAKLQAEQDVRDSLAREKLLVEQTAQRKREQEWLDNISEAYRINDDLNHKVEVARLADIAESNRLKAIKDKEQAEINAENARLQSVENERLAGIERQRRADSKIKEEAERREADKKYLGTVHRGILSVLIKNGVSEGDGKVMIKLAAKGLLPKLTINY